MRDSLGRFMKGHRKSPNAGCFKKGHTIRKGIMPWNYGKTLPISMKIRISNSHKGKKLSDEHKRKISLAGKGIRLSEEHKRKISESHKKSLKSIENMKKIRNSNIGKSLAIKTKEKISKSLKGRFKGKESPHWRGGKIKEPKYILIYLPKHPSAYKGYVYEHRAIVENIIKRFLDKKETVHHINHNTFDNKIENLIAFSNHGAHNKFANNKTINFSDIIFDGRKHISSSVDNRFDHISSHPPHDEPIQYKKNTLA